MNALRRWSTPLRWLVTLGALGLIASRVDWTRLGAQVARADVRWVALSALLSIGVILLMAVRWKCVLRACDLDVPLRATSTVTFIGQFFNGFLPGSTGGDVIKAWYASQWAPDRRAAPAVSIFYDRLLAMITLFLITTVILGIQAFAQADLRSNSGWKVRIEAGERLAAMGAIPPNRLLGLYTEQKAAASGGVWERVKAVQALEAALDAGTPGAIAAALPAAWAQMEALELEVPFAKLFGAKLAAAGLPGTEGALAFRIGLLSDDYEKIALARKPADSAEAFLAGLARGDLQGLTAPDQMGVAIQAAFADSAHPEDDLALLLRDHKLGEALLKAMNKVTEGASGDLRDVTEGLALLRQVGLEAPARRAGLELLLLERRG